MTPARRRPPDQADGLRRRFAAGGPDLLALVHNPFVAFAGVAMERIASALADAGVHTLVVDAADTASAAHELADVDLGACIEPLSAHTSYLAARGLPRRHLDSRGHAADFLVALHRAAPYADALLLHAGAAELRRIAAGGVLRPLLLAGTHPESVTHAYASIKLLAGSAGVDTFDLLIVGAGGGAATRLAAERVARRLDDCAARFLGVALRSSAAIDPAEDPRRPIRAELRTLLARQLQPSHAEPALAQAQASARPI